MLSVMMGTRQVRRQKTGKRGKLDNETSPSDDDDASSEKRTCQQPATEVTAGTSAVNGGKNKKKRGKKHSKKKSRGKVCENRGETRNDPFYHQGRYSSNSSDSGESIHSVSESSDSSESSIDTLTQTTTSREPPSLYSGRVGDHLGKAVLSRIRKNKYVDMCSLLPGFAHKKSSYALQFHGKNAKFVKDDHDINLSFIQWCDGFDIFMIAYLAQHPQNNSFESVALARDLMTYKTHITSLMKQHADWQAYDRHFRKSQEGHVSNWATLRVDLMFQYANKQTTRSFRDDRDSTQSCKWFNRGKCFSRDMCVKKHTCYKCKGNHPAIRCNQYRDSVHQNQSRDQNRFTNFQYRDSVQFNQNRDPVRSHTQTSLPALKGVQAPRPSKQ